MKRTRSPSRSIILKRLMIAPTPGGSMLYVFVFFPFFFTFFFFHFIFIFFSLFLLVFPLRWMISYKKEYLARLRYYWGSEVNGKYFPLDNQHIYIVTDGLCYRFVYMCVYMSLCLCVFMYVCMFVFF
jgi:hypothetical protein